MKSVFPDYKQQAYVFKKKVYIFLSFNIKYFWSNNTNNDQGQIKQIKTVFSLLVLSTKSINGGLILLFLAIGFLSPFTPVASAQDHDIQKIITLEKCSKQQNQILKTRSPRQYNDQCFFIFLLWLLIHTLIFLKAIIKHSIF